MTADAGGGEAAFGQSRRCAVRTAGAECGNATQQAGWTIGHARRGRVLDVQAGGAREAGQRHGDGFGDSSIKDESSGAPEGSVLPLTVGRASAGR